MGQEKGNYNFPFQFFFLPLLCQAAVHPAPYLNRQLMWNTPYKQNLIKTLLLSLKLFPDQVLSWLNGNLWLHLVDHIPYVTFAVFLDFLIGQISQYHDLKVTKMPKLFIKMDHEFRDAFNITFEFNLLILFFYQLRLFETNVFFGWKWPLYINYFVCPSVRYNFSFYGLLLGTLVLIIYRFIFTSPYLDHL